MADLRRVVIGVLFVLAATQGTTGQGAQVQSADRGSLGGLVDGFEEPASWSIICADGVSLSVTDEPGETGRCARLDYDFTRGSGYAIIRKELNVALPANYRWSFDVRGEGPSNTLEFKLVDESGDNVWWRNMRDYSFPAEWKTVTVPKRRIEFAWGPAGPGVPLKTARSVEIVVTATSGGKGTVWVDNLALEHLPEVQPFDGDAAVTWTAEGRERSTVLRSDGKLAEPIHNPLGPVRIDFGRARELGGLVLGGSGIGHEVRASVDGVHFGPPVVVASERVRTRFLVPMPDTVARVIEIQPTLSLDRRPTRLDSARVMPAEFGESANALLREAAAGCERGLYPRYFADEQAYWTVIGACGDHNEALMSEDGAVEVNKLSFSVEPLVRLEGSGAMLTWANAEVEQTLAEGCLPIPTVIRRWPREGLELVTTAFVDGPAGASTLMIRYELRCFGDHPQAGAIWLAARPMQVNPPTQNLNITGGAADVRHIRVQDGALTLDGVPLHARPAPAAIRASTFDSGEIAEQIAGEGVPTADDRRSVSRDGYELRDARGLASAALWYDFALKPGESRVIGLAIPMHPKAESTAAIPLKEAGVEWVESRMSAVTDDWRTRLSHVQLLLPGEDGRRITDSITANLAYILINRDGPGIQPGSRSYERSWIRDGALTSSAMLAFGFEEEVAGFLDWYGPYQYDSGKIPCVVDHRGPDPVPEHDSHGEYIHAVRNCFAFTQDTSFLSRHWPRVVKAVEYIEFLRAQRMTAEFEHGPDEKRVFYGLVPESISHEGYSAKPMHSYWDGFWTLRGLADAASLAESVGDAGRAAAYRASHDLFQRTLHDSISLAMRLKGIDYIPGCAELGDFDATSTTIALWPGGQLGDLRGSTGPAIDRTFARAYDAFRDRRDGTIAWRDYTPYELRLVGSMVLLGQRERAHEMLDWYFDDQRPPGWRMWAEVVRHGLRTPGFIGDMPHTWCGSDFINSVRLMLACARESDGALVLGAGVPRRWLEHADGVEAVNLRTEFGPLTLAASQADEAAVRIRVSPLRDTPRGGVFWSVPDVVAIESIRVNGEPVDILSWKERATGEVRLPSLPAEIEVRYRR